MEIVFRTDSSNTIGSGHVIRCLTLAQVLRKNGALISFVCRDHEGNISSLIEESGFFVHHLLDQNNGVSITHNSGPQHRSWLGSSWEEDAQQTISYILQLHNKPNWLVVDHYALDAHWERALKDYVERIFVIDDLADRHHCCDLLLDQNLVVGIQNRYDGMISRSCGLLIGPDYALLQPQYSELHTQAPPRKGPIRRILIYFGGFDNINMTRMALDALLNLNKSDIAIDVVLSDKAPYFLSIQTLISKYPNITLYSNLPSLAPIMMQADLTIGAAGTTSWERLCLGLPSVIISIAENQRFNAQCLAHYKLGWWVGHFDEISVNDISLVLSEIIIRGLDPEWSLRCLDIVDGFGAYRVSSVLLTDDKASLHARRAQLSDEMLIFEWANDPETRQYAFSSGPISLTTHQSWFRDHIDDFETCRIYVIETSDCIPIGQVRFEKQNDGWIISYSLARLYRGRNLGRHLINCALINFVKEFNPVSVYARVMENNVRSQKVLQSLQFKKCAEMAGEIRYMRRFLSPLSDDLMNF